MENKLNFTQQRIRNLPLPEKGRKDYWDTDVQKLCCRVSSSGTKSFSITKRLTTGRLQRVTLGQWPEVSVSQARKLALAALSEIADGHNPNELKRKKRYRSMTLQQLFDTYLDDKQDGLREATILDYTKKLNQGFKDWLNKPVNTITREMVKARRNSFTGGRDNKMRVLRLLMSYAHKTLKIIDNNPVDILTDGKLWDRPVRRERIIALQDLKKWYDAVLNLDNEKAKVYLLILIHTGLRDKDVRHLEWADVDFKNNSMTARDTKNHTDFTVYIAPQIKPYLRNLKQLTGQSRFLFPGDSKDGVMGIPRKPITQVSHNSGVEFSSHDLKRTFLTIGEAAMIPFSLLKTLANHKTQNDVTGGYINSEAETLKAATFKIADYIQQHTSPNENNILTLKSSTQ